MDNGELKMDNAGVWTMDVPFLSLSIIYLSFSMPQWGGGVAGVPPAEGVVEDAVGGWNEGETRQPVAVPLFIHS
jgi:hypothetical protein